MAVAGSFRDRPFAQRFGAMGDEAEGVFEVTYSQGWARWGINRPPINLKDVPEFVRYSPDYLTGKGFVEVQGFGRDQRFKLKHAKWDALVQWHETFRTDVFVWDSHNKRYGWLRLPELTEALHAHGTHDAFDGGANPYTWLPASDLPLADGWVAFDPRMN